jgi:FkbM family methyltransferase
MTDSGTMILSDFGGNDWHIARLAEERFNGCRIHLVLVCRIKGDHRSAIHVNHSGGHIICIVKHDGTIVDKGAAESLAVSRDADDWLTIDVIYSSGTPVFAIGLSKVEPTQHGYHFQEVSTCEIRSVRIDSLPFAGGDDRVVFVDVGARAGIPAPWAMIGSQVVPVMFEPDPEAASALVNYIQNFPGGSVVQAGLYNQSGERQLYLTRSPGCSSILPPNPRFTRHYAAPQIFDVMRTQTIAVSSYLDLFKAGKVPRPDVIKIDVQGCEYEVLEGFGDLLSDCLAIELETHISPLYHGQKLVTDIVALLDRFDFVLLDLDRVGSFNRPVEFEARFIRAPAWWTTQSQRVQRKGQIIRTAWGIGPNAG